MSTRFAAWVEPLAAKLVNSRKDIEHAIREIPADAWGKPSDYSRWSYKDQLSHLGDAHGNLQSVVQGVIDGRDPNFGRFARIDEINEENRQKGLTTPVAELLSAFVSQSEKTVSVLSGLKTDHEGFSLGPLTLSQALHGFTMHDVAHLGELRKALKV